MSLHRGLLFLDGDKSTVGFAKNDVGVGFVVGYSILAAAFYISLVHAIFVLTLPPKKREYFGNILFLLPWASLVLLLESCSLAVVAFGIERESQYHRVINRAWIDVVYALHSTIAPSIMIGTFEITYLVHKKRFLSFCCLPRLHPEDAMDDVISTNNNSSIGDDHHHHQPLHHDPLQHSQQSQLGWRSIEPKTPTALQRHALLALRMAIWLLAVMLMIVSILVYFPPSYWPRFQEDDAQNAVGRTGWSALIVHRYNFRLVLALLPMFITSICCLYFAMTLWRYGTTFAMVVHSSWFHPWFLPFYGDLLLFGGQCVGGRTWFSLWSRVGIFCYLECLNLALQEVSRDIEVAKQFQSFLFVMGSVEHTTTTTTAPPTQQQHHGIGARGNSTSSMNQQQPHHRHQNTVATSANSSSQTTSTPALLGVTKETTASQQQQQPQPPTAEQELQELSSKVDIV